MDSGAAAEWGDWIRAQAKSPHGRIMFRARQALGFRTWSPGTHSFFVRVGKRPGTPTDWFVIPEGELEFFASLEPDLTVYSQCFRRI